MGQSNIPLYTIFQSSTLVSDTANTAGAVVLRDTDCSINVGEIKNTINTITPGGSTAAAGSTYSDATALPAGTSSIYPTTAADDSKGVIITTSDKVTGRVLYIGNGVYNKVLKVYGPSGATINGGSANAGFSSVSGKGVIIVCLSSGSNTWFAW